MLVLVLPLSCPVPRHCLIGFPAYLFFPPFTLFFFSFSRRKDLCKRAEHLEAFFLSIERNPCAPRPRAAAGACCLY